jgi:bacillithiol biosynthesis cysteine-adding enzyme BshC
MREAGAAAAAGRAHMRAVGFRDMPHTTALFGDYVEDFAKVAAFFPGGDPGDDESYGRAVGVALGASYARDEIADALRELNTALGAPPEVLANIERLREPDVCAAVAGQQVAIFGGPLYTLYKALSAARICECFQERGVGRFVPIFWMATSDHDHAEVSWAETLCTKNQIHRLEYVPSPDDAGRPVGDLTLNESIDVALADLEMCTTDSEYKPALMAALRECYRPGRKLAAAFAAWMMRLVGRYGVIMADPSDPRLKRLAAPILQREIEDGTAMTRLLIERGGEIAGRGYHEQAQVHEGILNLFVADGCRESVHRDGDGFRIGPHGDLLTQADLLARLAAAPQTFSPNVLLRPIVQDTLFPTAAFVAGPSEIAYLAQVSVLYGRVGRAMPVIVPRASFTLAEDKIERVLDEYGIELRELAPQDDSLLLRVTRESMPQELLDLFPAAKARIGEIYEPLVERLRELDPTLIPTAEGFRGQAFHQIDSLEKKVISAAKRKEETLCRQIDKVRNALMPGGVMQERRLSICYFLIKYGWDVVDYLYRNVECPGLAHTLLRVSAEDVAP